MPRLTRSPARLPSPAFPSAFVFEWKGNAWTARESSQIKFFTPGPGPSIAAPKAHAAKRTGKGLRPADGDVAGVKGIAFERFFGGPFRGGIGQFFTPRPIVEFIVRMVKRLRYGMTGESRLALVPVTNVRCYECRVAEVTDDGAPGPWVTQGPFNSSQKIDVTGLTPGRVYIFQIRAFGGSTGASDWSDPVSHRSL